MSKTRIQSTLALCSLVLWFGAQELLAAPLDHGKSIEIQVTDSDQLAKDGWRQTAPEVWQKTLEDGTEAEIAFGRTGVERSLARLEEDVARLSQRESKSLSEDIQLLELLDEREELRALAARLAGGSFLKSENGQERVSVCGGTATFTHEYGWYNSAYPYVNSHSVWYQLVSGNATKQAYAMTSIDTGSTYTNSDLSETTNSWTVSAFASTSVPTWSCTASAHGWVSFSGGCQDFVCYSTSKSCDEIPY